MWAHWPPTHVYVVRSKNDATTVPAASTQSPTAQPSTRDPVAGPVLDGTYRVGLDFEHQTLNGAPEPSSDTTAWWAFRSTCTPAGCAATATKLDAKLNQAPKIPGSTDVFHFVEGQWQNVPAWVIRLYEVKSATPTAARDWTPTFWDPVPTSGLGSKFPTFKRAGGR